MSPTVGDHLLERLAANGVQRVYGYPGDGINGIMGAMNRAGSGIDGSGPLELVQVRHEEMAAFMACAHANSPARSASAWPPRAGRDPSAQRPLRRQARPPAGGRDRRPAGE